MTHPLTNEAVFLQWLIDEFELQPGSVDLDSPIVEGLAFDSLELFRLMISIEMLVPEFELPEQLDLRDVHVRDVYHYARNLWNEPDAIG